MNKPIIVGAGLLALFVVSTFAPYAAAQYQGLGSSSTGESSLENQLKLARESVAAAQANPHAGSGTPYLQANGVIGATVIAGGIFGGIFVAFVVRAKQVEKANRTR